MKQQKTKKNKESATAMVIAEGEFLWNVTDGVARFGRFDDNYMLPYQLGEHVALLLNGKKGKLIFIETR